MPIPSITGRPLIVTSVSGMPRYPARPNAQITPMSTIPSGNSRHRTSKSTSRITIMIATAMAPSISMPPLR